MQAIDRKTLDLLASRTDGINADVVPRWPRPEVPDGRAGPIFGPDPTNLKTVNPPADQMPFTVNREDPEEIIRKVTTSDQSATATVFGLQESVAYAVANGREYQNAAENYVILALSLLIEQHRWGPRFFDDVSANVSTVGDDGLFAATTSVLNDFTVRQRLPYGGEVSASFLASAAWNLTEAAAGQDVQSAAVLLQGNIPLLRGAGLAAREELIQAERNLIYAAREFERFRRRYVFDISTDFLSLVVESQAIDNARRQVVALEEAEARELALFQAGRRTGYDVGLAAQSTLFATNSLAAQIEIYRLAVDRFKVRIGMPTEQSLAIDSDSLGIPTPETNIDRAVAIGLANRLDLQTERDRIEDARRRVDVARNNLLPDLNLSGNVNLPTDPTRRRPGLDLDPGFTSASAGATLGIPLDREIERARLRESQILLEQSSRRYSEQRDTIVVNIRDAVRQIDRAVFSIRLQEENVRIAKLRQESINAAPDRVSARDRRDAIDDQLRAEDGLIRAERDLQVAVLGYLLATDQLRVDPRGQIIPLAGMSMTSTAP
jgi:outer membrane protein TolC